MDRSGAFCRWVAARPVAVLFTVGAVAVGLSACGSSSSSGTKPSTSSVVKKEAGTFSKQVQLTVENKTPVTLALDICANSQNGNLPVKTTCEGAKVAPEQSTVSRGDWVTGWAQSPRSDFPLNVDFRAENPDVGRPWMSVSEAVSGGCIGGCNVDALTKWALSEGDTRDTTVGGRVFFMSRADDTDVKVMTLTVVR